MKKALLLLPLLAVSACASTSQGKLRQAVYDMDSAYHILANPMPDVMAGKVPGVTLTDTQKTLVKKASASVFTELSALNKSAEAGDSLTETAVSAVQADVAAFTACWLGVKSGTTPTECTTLAGSN